MSYVFDLIKKEKNRQRDNIELIASENFVSDDVMRAVGSCLTNKYSEGYPNHRYYGGCQFVDELETYCQDKWREVFNTDYHVNVQPHSGSQANLEAYMSVLDIGDTILSMSLDAGAHLTHSSPASFVSRLFNVVTYGLDENGFINYEEIADKIMKYRPKMIVAGASAYSRIIDFNRIRMMIDTAVIIENESKREYKPYFMVDMAHIAGLVASGDHPSPFGIADIITTTTHKTLRGTRGGLIFCRQELAKKVDSSVFPRNQGGPLQHIIAGKAITAEEDCTEEFKDYIHRVVKNTKAMCEEFKRLGYDIVTGGTDNHLFLIDFSKTHPNITGAMVQNELDKYGITLNKNCVPNEKRKPTETSGVRIGCAAMTTKGYDESDFVAVADKIDEIIKSIVK